MPTSASLRLMEVYDAPSGERAWAEIAPASRRFPLGALIIGLVLFLAAAAVVALPRPERRAGGLVRVTVAPGDTLWGLAQRYGGPRSYLPKAVYEIRRLNGLSASALVPGQSLLMPVEAPVPSPRSGGVLIARSNPQ